MYKFSYAEFLEEDVHEARAREQAAIDRAIELMTIAGERGRELPEARRGSRVRPEALELLDQGSRRS